MSVFNDMASDAGYKYGSNENEQMARMIEEEEERKFMERIEEKRQQEEQQREAKP